VNALSPRQRQIMELVATGLTNRDIAAQFGLQADTVRLQRREALRRLGAKTSPHAVAIMLGRAA